MSEEVGRDLGPDAVLGVLDDYVTRSGYVMTPVVCWAGPVGELIGAEAEVAAVHQVPLADLDVEPRFITIPESAAPVIQLPLFGRYVHAPTAAIVHQFCRIACRGRARAVAFRPVRARPDGRDRPPVLPDRLPGRADAGRPLRAAGLRLAVAAIPARFSSPVARSGAGGGW